MAQIYTRTLRLNLERPDEYEAWDHLMKLDRSEIHSCNQAIVRAINYYFRTQNLRKEDSLSPDPLQSAPAYRNQSATAHPGAGQAAAHLPDSNSAAESSSRTAFLEKEKACTQAALEFLDSF